MSGRIVVFSGELSFPVRQAIVEIDRLGSGLRWLVLVQVPRRHARRLLRNQWINLKRNGWRWIPYQLGDLWQRSRRRPPNSAAGLPGAEYARDSLEARKNVTVLEVEDLHSAHALETVQRFAPDLGLSLAAPILRRALFSLPARGTINLHKGSLPAYRGMPPAFWELWDDQPSVGCSVHCIDDGLDTGALIVEDEVPRPRFATVRGMQLQLDELGSSLVSRATFEMLSGRALPRPQATGRFAAHRKPTLSQQAELNRRLAPPRPWPRRAKEAVKACRAGAVIALNSGLPLARLSPRISVLLYHRVSDDARDNLTIGIGQFDRQMAILARHCTILTIEEVLAAQAIEKSSKPLVAVTFDDGYEDNFRHAAPILRRHGIPAAFYVSTGIVDTANRFPHDVRRNNPPIPLMTWAQIRTLREWGFSIGSHSVSHIDCAAEPAARVREELVRSRDDLAREVGVREPVFAYPYGGRQNMTAERLTFVRDAGYVGCLSAYGGTNVGAVDRFNVLRRGIDWTFSDRSFMLECLGAQ